MAALQNKLQRTQSEAIYFDYQYNGKGLIIKVSYIQAERR